MFKWLVLFLLAGGTFAGANAAQRPDYDLDPRLTLSLFAKEPDVVDPVALTWDEDGNMYVVEMRDYPYGLGPDRKPGGTVRLLQDSNGDGKLDRSTVFATDLSFPTSVAPWNGGIIITAPPEVIFLKDTNRDGKADVREVLLKGFVMGVTDSNVNGLRWGLDNRLHGANGGNGGSISSTRKPGPPISVRNLDFSFVPRSGDFTPTWHTSGGFGLVFDDWGRAVVTYNINHIQQPMIPARYLDRFPGFPPIHAVESISDHGDMARIYPISEPETRVNHPEQSGHFSSAGGLGLIGSTAFPEDLYGSVLVCDVVGNLVHRDVLSLRGPVLVASRASADKEREFFASRDRACRPVGVELGPDGALYLIDMQRDVIEHPDYIPQPVRAKLDLRAGDSRGRIYRITPKSGLPARTPKLRGAPATELVEYLGHTNAWYRYTAQRLLVQRRHEAGWNNSIIPRLESIAASAREPLGRLHALWTLSGLGELDESLVRRALSDAEPGIRENAVLLAEPFLSRSRMVGERILAMADDAHPRVRFQVALALGQLQTSAPDAGSRVNAALTRILLRDCDHRWTRVAVCSSFSQGEDAVLSAVARESSHSTNASRLALVRELADLIGARCGQDRSEALAAVISLAPGISEACQVALLEGLESGLARNRRVPALNSAGAALSQLTNSPALLAAAWRLSRKLALPETEAQRAALTQATQLARDVSQPLASRLENTRLLSLGDYQAVGETLFALLDGAQPAPLQLASINVLHQFNERSVAQKLIEHWPSLAPAARSAVLNLLLQRVAFHEVLVDALERGQLTVGELNLDLEQRRRLLWESSPEVKSRAARLIGDGEYANRKTVVDDWLKRLPASGDPVAGRAVFEKACAQCHSFRGLGHAVGPDLGALAHRSLEDLLSNILDPNMAINPAYVGYTAETATGEIESGILHSETDEAIELLQAFGRKVVLPRARIKRLRSTGLSVMPEGLENGLSPAELRDVISFLQQRL